MSDFLKGVGGVAGFVSGGALFDMVGNALGLPPLITNAAKTAVGAMTGNVLLAADGAMGLAQELSKNPPAATEYATCREEQRAGEGYAKPAPREHADSPVKPGEGTGDSRVSHLDPKLNDYLDTLRTLQQNFSYLDATDGTLDGSLSRADLRRISEDTRVSPELRKAARFLTDNPGYFERLETSVGASSLFGADRSRARKNDDRFDLTNVRSEFFQVQADFAQYGRPERPGASRPSTPPLATGDEKVPAPGGTKPPSGPAPAQGPARSSVKDIINDPGLSLEEKLNTLLMSLTQKMDDEMLRAMDDLAAAQDRKSGLSNAKGNEKALTQAQGDIDRISLRLQQLVEKRKMMFEMMSTLSMKFNEMAKTALSNMRGA